MPFLELLYLHQLVKCPCRCFFRFAVSASAYKIPLQIPFSVIMQEYASATCSFSILQILPCKNLHLQLAFSLFCRYSTPKKFIRNFLFRYLADTPLQKFASASCFFSILQILPTQKVHPQLAFSLSCRYSPVPTHSSINLLWIFT